VPFVATVAFDFPMFVSQGILRVPIMLKEDNFPAAFRVTAYTFLSVTAFVRVLFLVAGVTIGRGLILIQMSLMASFAFCAKMAATQRILCMQVVIEGDRLPVSLNMAAFALLSGVALVFVVFLVASVTVRRRILESRRQMAFFAFHLLMSAKQRETRLVVVKRSLLPGTFVMAFIALSPFLSLMLVVFLVATVAV
jgi:hypothetical protein